MSNLEGMDLDAVAHLANRLDAQALIVEGLVTTVDVSVRGLADIWHGDVLGAFSTLWHGGHRPNANSAAASLREAARQLRAQQQEQALVSSTLAQVTGPGAVKVPPPGHAPKKGGDSHHWWKDIPVVGTIGDWTEDRAEDAADWVKDRADDVVDAVTDPIVDWMVDHPVATGWIAATPSILANVAGTAADLVTGGRQDRRLDRPDQADEQAAQTFHESSAAQRQVDADRMLCEATYDETGAPTGWTRLKNETGPDGGFAAVFENGKGEIVVAFRGSEPSDARDWREDVENANGNRTAQGTWAADLAKRLDQQYGGRETYAGHSLGGSLAAQASLATGRGATTFNAAGVGDGNYAYAAAGGHGNEHRITNYSTTNDMLTGGQHLAGVHPAAGAQVYVHSLTEPSTGEKILQGVAALSPVGQIYDAYKGVSSAVGGHDLQSFDWSDYAEAPGHHA